MLGARAWWRDTTGGLPRTFWYLWTGSLINRLGSFAIIFLAIYLTSAQGLSETQAGLVVGGWGAGGAIGTLAGGVLADRWGRRPTLLTAHLGAAVMLLALGFADQLWQLAGAAVLLGAFSEAARPAFSAMMIDLVPARDRLKAFSLNYWAVNLGFSCAAVLAGLAAQVDYLLLFAVNALTTVITAAIIFTRVGETRPARPAPTGTIADPAEVRSGLRTILTDRVFVGFVGLNLLLALVFMQHTAMLPIAMATDGLTPAVYGGVIALNGVLIVTGQLFVPRLIRDRSRSHVLALAALITGIGFGLTAVADAAWFYAITVLIWTLGEMLNSPSNATLTAELTPAPLRGRYQGFLSLSWSIAAFVAPIGGGFVREHGSDVTLWVVCGVIGGAVAVGQLVAGPARERRAASLRVGEHPTDPDSRIASERESRRREATLTPVSVASTHRRSRVAPSPNGPSATDPPTPMPEHTDRTGPVAPGHSGPQRVGQP
ncbi:MFS transporter [Solwaraspora sp. WMMD406]|nr:MFS transporter [Solwaraspora sp. WMMD406]MDG4768181.1 MFS transporter [Solwaraspora sp. WMMD406]